MALTEILSIQPGELKFPFELKKQVSSSLHLVNTTDDSVAFKVKTTSPKKYCVRPNTGIVLPRSTCDITVTMQAQREAPPDMQCKDKFLVQSVIAPNGISANNISQELFYKDAGKEVYEAKLRVVYVYPARPPSPVPESADEGLSPREPPIVDNGDQNFMSYEMGPKEISELKSKLVEAHAQVARLTQEMAAIQKNQQFQQVVQTSSAFKTAGKNVTEKQLSSGFSFLFVLLVGFLGILVGFLLRS